MSDVSVSIGVTGKDQVLGAFSQVGNAAKKLGSLGLGAINTAAMAGAAASIAAIGASMAGMKGALDLGGEMVDLSNRTGVAVESLYGLRTAFKDAGVDAEKLGPAVNKMQKALASAVGGGKEGDVLKSLGLDPQSLASMDSGQAFAQIGNAISQLPNSVERSAAAMALFGKSGGELLQVFMDPNFKSAGNISETARMLGENAGIFDKASDSLGRVGPKLQGLFVGMASGMTGLLDSLANGIDGIDLAGIGQKLGNVIGNFSTDFSGEWSKVVQFIGDTIGLVFSKEGLSVILDSFYYIGSQIRDFLIRTFKTPLDYLEAGLQKAVESAMEMVGKIPVLGEKLGLKGFKATSFDQILGEVQSRGNGLTNLSAEDAGNKAALGSNLKERIGVLADQLKESLAPVVTATDATSAANAAARVENAGRNPAQGNFNGADIGQVAKQSIFADSLAKIGGGGISVGGGSNPILEENKRQTSLLQSINQNLAKGMMSPVMAEFAPSY
jgi:hypothetical protein